MKPNVKRLLTAAACLFLSAMVSAQGYAQPVTIIVPYAAGGAGDIGVRLIGPALSSGLGQPVVVQNKGGAGGAIGTELGAKAASDGNTLTLGSDVAMSILPHLRKLNYDPQTSFEPIGLIATLPMVIVVNPNLGVSSVADLVQLSKKRQLNLGTNGIGTNAHLTAELIRRETKLDFVHVPFSAQPQVINSVMSGDIDFAISSVGPVLSHIRSGKLKALALTSANRLGSLPDVPTLKESGYAGIDVNIWLGLFAPAKTSQEVIAKLSVELRKALASADVQARYAELGYVPGDGTPERLARLMSDDLVRWKNVIADGDVRE